MWLYRFSFIVMVTMALICFGSSAALAKSFRLKGDLPVSALLEDTKKLLVGAGWKIFTGGRGPALRGAHKRSVSLEYNKAFIR